MRTSFTAALTLARQSWGIFTSGEGNRTVRVVAVAAVEVMTIKCSLEWDPSLPDQISPLGWDLNIIISLPQAIKQSLFLYALEIRNKPPPPPALLRNCKKIISRIEY